jgi:hypothetical protein
MRKPDFIGLGAQKSGSSWIYACLHEHPEICIPTKEIHFFSRERNWSKGYEWYESQFERCSQSKRAGEFSTTYLFDEQTPERIHRRYPNARLIACLRNPMDRAFSNYINDIKAGAVSPDTKFMAAVKQHPEYIEQGRYAIQLKRYSDFFGRDQFLVLLHEDSRSDPLSFMQSIYEFLGVAKSYVPSLLNTKINVARIPRFPIMEHLMNNIAEGLREYGFDRLVWYVKKSKLPDAVRHINTQKKRGADLKLNDNERRYIYEGLRQDIDEVSRMFGRTLDEWRL